MGTQERESLHLAHERQVCVRQLESLDAKDGSGKKHSRAQTWKHCGSDGAWWGSRLCATRVGTVDSSYSEMTFFVQLRLAVLCLLKLFYVHLFTGKRHANTCSTTHMWRSEDNFPLESCPPDFHSDSRNQTRGIVLVSSSVNPFHHPSPKFPNNKLLYKAYNLPLEDVCSNL